MLHTRNATTKESPDFIRIWVTCAIFCGVSSAVYDVLKSVGDNPNNPVMGLQAMVYTTVLAALFFLVRTVISKGNIKRAAFTLLGMCTVGFAVIQVGDAIIAPHSQPGIAQTHEQHNFQ
jgi:hypothetical protein